LVGLGSGSPGNDIALSNNNLQKRKEKRKRNSIKLKNTMGDRDDLQAVHSWSRGPEERKLGFLSKSQKNKKQKRK